MIRQYWQAALAGVGLVLFFGLLILIRNGAPDKFAECEAKGGRMVIARLDEKGPGDGGRLPAAGRPLVCKIEK